MRPSSGNIASSSVPLGSALDTQAEWLGRPVLLYGARKSGTTLLMSLLDGGEQLMVYPNEVKLKLFARRAWDDPAHMTLDYLTHGLDPLKRPLRDPNNRIAPTRAIPPGSQLVDVRSDVTVELGNLAATELPGRFDTTTYLDHLRRASGRPFRSFRELLEYDLAAFCSSMKRPPARLSSWAVKEVGGNPQTVIGYFKGLFPTGKVVVITREPRRVAHSILSSRRRRGVRKGLREALAQIHDAARHPHFYEDLLDNRTVHFVRYGRLVGGDLEAEMRALCEFLDVDYSERLLQPTTLGRETVVRTSSESVSRVFNPDTAGGPPGLSRGDSALLSVTFGAIRLVQRAWPGIYPRYPSFTERLRRRARAASTQAHDEDES